MKKKILFLIILFLWHSFQLTCIENPFVEPSAYVHVSDTTIEIGDSIVLKGEGNHDTEDKFIYRWSCPQAESFLSVSSSIPNQAVFHANKINFSC